VLPFTESQFFDLFGRYNSALWPAAAALWAATLVAVVQLARARAAGTAMSGLLALHWAWSGLAYHAAFFTAINPAAWLFAAMFVLQAVLLVWVGLVRGRLRFVWPRGFPGAVAGTFLVASLVYPVLVLADGHAWPRAPIFAVPCPTLLFTAGALLAAAPSVPRALLVIPIVWAIIGGSAAFRLGVTPDLLLLAAALAMVTYAIAPAAFDSRRPAEMRP
jgi:hypothetical protein